MRILFVTASSGSKGGGELYLLKLAQGLSRLGHSLALACAKHIRMDRLSESFEEYGEVFRIDYTNTYDLPGKSLHYLVSPKAFFPDLENAVCQWNPDILHLNKQNLEDALDLLKWFSLQKLPVVQTIHILRTPSELGARLGVFRNFVMKRSLQNWKIPTILIASESERAAFEHNKIVRWSVSEHIPNGVSPLPNARKSLSLNPLKFVAISRLHQQKRPFLWLDWARQILEKIPNAQFAWIGDGPLESQFIEAIRARSLAQVEYHGWVSDPERFINDSHYLMHSAAYEGQPFAILEALSAGLPVIADDALMLSQSELNPAMIPINDVLADEAILTNEELYSQKNEEALRIYESSYTLESMTSRTVDFYNRIVSEQY